MVPRTPSSSLVEELAKVLEHLLQSALTHICCSEHIHNDYMEIRNGSKKQKKKKKKREP